MPKSWFRFSLQDDVAVPNGAARNGPAVAAAVQEVEPAREVPPVPERNGSQSKPDSSPYLSFDQVYSNATVKPPRMSYGILKIAEMVNSPHLSGMSQEARRSSLMMALEAAGVEVEDLLQDAVVRQRALSDYEEVQQAKLKKIEDAKAAENNQIQAELDNLTGQYLSRIQRNLDEIAREQDRFRAWQKRKLEESQKITEAATYCVPQGSTAAGGSLTSVLERATRR